jgi:hypothetical protein
MRVAVPSGVPVAVLGGCCGVADGSGLGVEVMMSGCAAVGVRSGFGLQALISAPPAAVRARRKNSLRVRVVFIYFLDPENALERRFNKLKKGCSVHIVAHIAPSLV